MFKIGDNFISEFRILEMFGLVICTLSMGFNLFYALRNTYGELNDRKEKLFDQGLLLKRWNGEFRDNSGPVDLFSRLEHTNVG